MRGNEDTNFTIRAGDQTKRNEMLCRNKTISSNNPDCLYKYNKEKISVQIETTILPSTVVSFP